MSPAVNLKVLRLRDFRLVFGAATVSLIGDGVLPLALSFAVLDLTDSATDLGIVLAVRTVGLVLALLAGGVIADRIGRRKVMIAADLVRFVGQAAIGVMLIAGSATVFEIAISQLLLGAASGFFDPASSGLIPEVAGDHLQQANALSGMSRSASNIAGPAIAGLLVVAASPGWALLIDAVSYAASAALLSCVRRDGPKPRQASGFLDDLRGGFAEVRSRTWVWAGMIAFSVLTTFALAFPVLGALTATRYLGGAGAWSAILIARAVGALLASISLLGLRPRRPLLVATLAGMPTALPTILLGIPAPLVLIVIAAFISGVGPMVVNTLWDTTMQQHIPPSARSRVSAWDWLGSMALQPIGYALIGPLATGIGLSTALYLCGGVEFASLALLLTVRDIRTLGPKPSGPVTAIGG